MIRSRTERLWSGVNAVLLTAIGLATLYPFWYVLIASLSDGLQVISGDVWVLPKVPTLDAYRRVVGERGIWTGYANSLYITGMGTLVSMAITTAGAYALSKARLRGRVMFTFFVVLTMWFDAGIIPTFLNFRSLGLYNTRAAVILGFAVVPFYAIILRTFFQSVPSELEESAKMDGASDLIVLARIYVPVSVAAIATISLYYGVARWNGYFWSMILLKDESKIPLQVLLKKIVYAIIVVAIVPVLLIYPFVQRYFAKGIMIGSLKG
jgi:putative aldouronate transport system permease protein